jgi:hypothetical protein
MAHINKFFYRCDDCLTVAVTIEKLPAVYNERGYAHYATCDACGGQCDYMGQVEGNHLVRTALECPCDGRCTGALGPSCDCSCGGENHGSGLLVEVVKDGHLPRLMTSKDALVKALAFRALYAEVDAAWTARYGYLTNLKRQQYLDGSQYALYMNGAHARKLIGKAKGMATHAGRNKRLTALLAEFKGTVTSASA